MYNAVLDTNILVSELLSSQGNPAKIINAFRDMQINLIYDTAITAKAYLVTGNIKHYPTKPFIITPVQFVTLAQL